MNKDAPKMYFLRRIIKNKDVTQGILVENNRVLIVTLELPWNNNERFNSCIPEGVYTVRRGIYKPKKGDPYESFYLENVRDRSGIWFHVGNIVDDTDGCILTGSYYGMYKNKPAVLASKKAHKIMMESFKELDYFMLIITDNS